VLVLWVAIAVLYMAVMHGGFASFTHVLTHVCVCVCVRTFMRACVHACVCECERESELGYIKVKLSCRFSKLNYSGKAIHLSPILKLHNIIYSTYHIERIFLSKIE